VLLASAYLALHNKIPELKGNSAPLAAEQVAPADVHHGCRRGQPNIFIHGEWQLTAVSLALSNSDLRRAAVAPHMLSRRLRRLPHRCRPIRASELAREKLPDRYADEGRSEKRERANTV